MPAYTFPPEFDVQLARKLASLINAAYDQLKCCTCRTAWPFPDGYTAIAPAGPLGPLETVEIWQIPGLLHGWIEHRLPKVPFGFIAQEGSDVFVVIRGTKTPLEWLDDATAGPVPFEPFKVPWGKVTRGFWTLYEALGVQIIGALRSITANGGRIGRVFVTGHSLGGALAQLAAADIATGLNLTPITYTFCSPRAGDPEFAAKFTAAKLPVWRVFNTEDVVPTLPPAAIKGDEPKMGILHHAGQMVDGLIRLVQLSPSGYQHVGYPIAVTVHGDSVTDNHSLDTVCAQLAPP